MKHFLSPLAGLILLALSCVPQTKAGAASVNFTVIDNYGAAIPYRLDVFRAKGSGRSFLSSFKGLHGSSIPYGEYEYALNIVGLKAPRVSTLAGTLSVQDPDHWVTLMPSGDYFIGRNGEEHVADLVDFPASMVTGKVMGCPKDASCWVRITSPITHAVVDAPLRKDGSFVAYRLRGGAFVALVFSERGLLCANTVTMRKNEAKQITIACLEGPPK